MLYPIELRALRQVRQLAEASWRSPSAYAVAFAHSAMILARTLMPVKAAVMRGPGERRMFVAVTIGPCGL